jgi:hypothetical protein
VTQSFNVVQAPESHGPGWQEEEEESSGLMPPQLAKEERIPTPQDSKSSLLDTVMSLFQARPNFPYQIFSQQGFFFILLSKLFSSAAPPVTYVGGCWH